MNLALKRRKMNKALEPILGFVLSIITWETWENMIAAIIIAFLGGFASMGARDLYKLCFKKTKKNESTKNPS
jgi:hypothetical protein